MHLTIDGYGGDASKLADAELVRSVLDRYPGEIGMTKISVPRNAPHAIQSRPCGPAKTLAVLKAAPRATVFVVPP